MKITSKHPCLYFLSRNHDLAERVFRPALIFMSLLTIGLFSIFFISCGGCNGGGRGGGSPLQNTIEIEMPTFEAAYTTDCNEVWVGGEANYPASQWNNVEISWENQSVSGLSQGIGQTNAKQCLGWFLGYTWYYDCDAGWWAEVPLEIGNNTITITAVDLNGTVIGKGVINVYKPVMSYYVTGRIPDSDGTGLFNIKVKRNVSDGFTYTDSDGNYELGCLRSETYSVNPDSMGYHSPTDMFFSYINWPFVPASRTVIVNDSDVTGQDFSTEVYEVQIVTLSGQ